MSPQPPYTPPDGKTEEALERFVAATSGHASARDRQDFERWAQAAAGRRHEVERLKEVAQTADFLRPLYAQNARQLRRSPARRVRSWLGWGVAACATALVFAFTTTRTISADAGRPRSVVLHDGSVVDLDAGSALEVSWIPWRRQVRLIKGEALFDVVHDESNPFMVSVGGANLVDVGTRFFVSSSATPLVAVFDGAVNVTYSGAAFSQNMTAGQTARVSAAGLRAEPMLVEADATAWRQGRIIFRSATLETVANRLTRYHSSRVVVGSPSLSDLKVSGSFDIGNTEGILRTLERVLPVRIRRDEAGVVLIPASSGPQ